MEKTYYDKELGLLVVPESIGNDKDGNPIFVPRYYTVVE